MGIGERIRYFRTLRGMTQKKLGMALGFPEGSADVRLAQYETGGRTPRGELTLELARILEVSPRALTVPDMDSAAGLLHTLFALEDIHGLRVDRLDGQVCLRLEEGSRTEKLRQLLEQWARQQERLEAGEITRQEYDFWRYHYPGSEEN